MELIEHVKDYLHKVLASPRGANCRHFMARTILAMGDGRQRLAEIQLGWNRVTIRRGILELRNGILVLDSFSLRGRKRVEEHLPNLLTDLQELVDAASQIDPTFRSQRLYSRLTAREIRQLLRDRKGYRESQMPSVETIRRKLHQIGNRLRKVCKSKPKKGARNRRNLCGTDEAEPCCGCLRKHPPGVDRCEGKREHRVLFP